MRVSSWIVVAMLVLGAGCKKKPKVDRAACQAATDALAQAWLDVDKAFENAGSLGPGDLTDLQIKADVFTKQAGDDPKQQAEAKAFQAQFETAKAWVTASRDAKAAMVALHAPEASAAAATDAAAKIEALRTAGAAYATARGDVIEKLLGETLASIKATGVHFAKNPELLAQHEQTLASAQRSYDEATGDVASLKQAVDAVAASAKAAFDKRTAATAACTAK